MKQIYRMEFRGQKKDGLSEELFLQDLKLCEENVRNLQKEGRLMTVAMYHYKESLFLYYEVIAEADPVTNQPKESLVQAEDICAPVSKYLKLWPEMEGDSPWAKMYEIFYHVIPQGVESWKRSVKPEHRRGRIAFLKPEKMFDYTYYHRALTKEGLLKGDRYQYISLHENLLFSYFEEPRSSENWRKSEEPSKIIDQWLEVNPDEHFIPHKENGKGFLILPEYFALGIED